MAFWHQRLAGLSWVSFLAIGLSVAMLAIIGYFAVLSPDPLPDRWWLRGHNDIALHALAFGAITVPLAVLVGPWPSLMAASIVAALVELIQVPMPRRSATVEDLLAGIAGAALVAVMAAIVRRMRR